METGRYPTFIECAARHAAIEVPRSPRRLRLSRLLYEQAERAAKDDRHDAGDDIVEDYFTIERVERGALWLTGGIGPVKVDPAASSLARPGWSVYLVLARSPRGWQVLEAGNVYP